MGRLYGYLLYSIWPYAIRRTRNSRRRWCGDGYHRWRGYGLRQKRRIGIG